MRQDDSSRIVTETHAECKEPDAVPTTVDDALRLAIKLAVDAGDYERAKTLLDVADATKPASVTPLASVRTGRPR